MDVNDLLHQIRFGKVNEVKHAASQECVRKFLFIVRRDDDQWSLLRNDFITRFHNGELHFIDFPENVVGELEICLVNFVN